MTSLIVMVVIYHDDDNNDDDDDEAEGDLDSGNVVEHENKQPAASKAIASAATFGLFRRARQ